jgi:hypothetical protein
MNELYETKIGKWLSLGRIQSAPLTATMYLVFYGIGGGVLLSVEGATLFGATVLAHWAVFTHNDILDAPYDKQKDTVEYKPIASGQISEKWAMVSVPVVGLSSVVLVSTAFGALSIIGFGVLGVIGITYNLKSKETVYGPLILILWGAASVLVCGGMAGPLAWEVFMFSVGVGALSGWLIFFGDVLDIKYEEESLLDKTGYRIYWADNSSPRYTLDGNSRAVAFGFHLFEGFIPLAAIIGILGKDVTIQVLSPLFSVVCYVAAIKFADTLKGPCKINRPKLKKEYFAHLAFMTISTLWAAFQFIGSPVVLFLVLTSTAWQLTVQKIQYDRWIFFP